MKTLLPTGLALALLLGLGLAQAPSQDGGGAGDDARLRALETEVAALKDELKANKLLLEQTTRYLAGAKARSTALLKAFDQAQDAGFTAGINFHSREILLAGLRAYASDEAVGLPGEKKPQAEDGSGAKE
jgi:hypothetical protein